MVHQSTVSLSSESRQATDSTKRNEMKSNPIEYGPEASILTKNVERASNNNKKNRIKIVEMTFEVVH